eukprot:6180132-Pyramimonas_sp.AAC.1
MCLSGETCPVGAAVGSVRGVHCAAVHKGVARVPRAARRDGGGRDGGGAGGVGDGLATRGLLQRAPLLRPVQRLLRRVEVNLGRRK